jgi:hypothetical protein
MGTHLVICPINGEVSCSVHKSCFEKAISQSASRLQACYEVGMHAMKGIHACAGPRTSNVCAYRKVLNCSQTCRSDLVLSILVTEGCLQQVHQPSAAVITGRAVGTSRGKSCQGIE